jgi:hypothetical protein
MLPETIRSEALQPGGRALRLTEGRLGFDLIGSGSLLPGESAGSEQEREFEQVKRR